MEGHVTRERGVGMDAACRGRWCPGRVSIRKARRRTDNNTPGQSQDYYRSHWLSPKQTWYRPNAPALDKFHAYCGDDEPPKSTGAGGASGPAKAVTGTAHAATCEVSGKRDGARLRKHFVISPI